MNAEVMGGVGGMGEPAGGGRWRLGRVLSIGSTGMLALWAALWLWFAATVVSYEGIIAWQPFAFMGALIGLSLAAWRWPVVGGALLAVVAASLFSYYDNRSARLLLILPAVVIGLARIASALLQPRHPRSARRAS